jgi:hypothetical protein
MKADESLILNECTLRNFPLKRIQVIQAPSLLGQMQYPYDTKHLSGPVSLIWIKRVMLQMQ